MDASLLYSVDTQEVTRAFPGPQVADALYVDRFFTSQETTSVMLPLLHEENYHPRVLVCGAVNALIADLTPVGDAPPQWVATAPRRLIDPVTRRPPVRNFANSTLLPTGDVVLTGGVTTGKYTEADGVRTAELYHPPFGAFDGAWEVGPVARETRGYHSVALLLPDGRVWTAGSEWNDTTTPNLAIELLEPAYYRQADRVAITGAPTEIGYGHQFVVQFQPTTNNPPIQRVALTRLGSATHSFDGDQRYVSVPFVQNGTTVRVTAPSDGTIAPPGYYLLCLIDANGLPCRQAWFLRVHHHG
jgi:hypothetical protein